MILGEAGLADSSRRLALRAERGLFVSARTARESVPAV
jgi:hypothetical protein